jgi:hypothetical protein
MSAFNSRTSDNNRTSSFNGNVRPITQKIHQLGSNAREAIQHLPDLLNKEQIKRLKEHKYASEGTTLFDPFMQKFWKWLVEYCPLWVAPNLLTITGLAINIGTSVSLIVLTDGAREQVNIFFFGENNNI